MSPADFPRLFRARSDLGRFPAAGGVTLEAMPGTSAWEAAAWASYSEWVSSLATRSATALAEQPPGFPLPWVERGDFLPMRYRTARGTAVMLLVRDGAAWQVYEPALHVESATR